MKIKRRQHQLVRLLSRVHEYEPMSYYARNLNVSTRTISNDLNELDEIFAKYNLILERKPNHGVLLKGERTDLERLLIECARTIESDSVLERYARQAEILKVIVLTEKTVTYEKLSFMLSASTSLVFKDMADLRKYENEHCRILSDVNGTRIKGTEYGKQKLLKDFFNSYMNNFYPHANYAKIAKVLAEYYPKSVVEVAKTTLDDFQDIFRRSVENYYLNSLFIFLATIVARKTKGKELKADFELVGRESVEILSNYHLAVEINEKLGEKLGIEFTKNEIDYISYQLFMHKIELNINNKYLESLLENHIRNLIKGIGKSVGLDISRDENLYDALICHMIPMIYRIRSNISIENPILNEIKKNYPVLFNLTWFHLNDFAKQFGIVFSEDEISFITIHLQVAIERASSRGYVIVVCETGLVTSELLVSRIRKNLPSSVELAVIPLNKMTQEDVDSADFIISTITLENMRKPYIKVSPVVTDEELKAVYYHYLKYSESEIVRFTHSKKKRMKFIPDLITPGNIHVQKDIKTKGECIDYLVNALQAKGYVRESFKNNILEREMLGSTYLAAGVGFPHAMSDNVLKSALVVISIPKGLFWDDNLVHLVMMLAIKEEDVEKIIEELPMLYKRVLDDEFVASVASLSDTQAVYGMLLGCESEYGEVKDADS